MGPHASCPPTTPKFSGDGLNGSSQLPGGEGTWRRWLKPQPMIEVSRTLMKSEPELAELIATVEGVEVRMAEKGFGTQGNTQLGVAATDTIVVVADE